MNITGHWKSLDSRTQLVIAVATIFALGRILLATQSSFPWHQGWNEGHYALLAEGFLQHPLVPSYGGHYVYNVTPLYPYLIAVFFAVFGETTVVARTPSILFSAGTILMTYFLGHRVFANRDIAAAGACLLAILPYFALYGGRTQTDITMLFFFTSGLYAIIRGYEDASLRWLTLGGVLFSAGFSTKQPVLLLPAVVLVWLIVERRYSQLVGRETVLLIISSALSLLPLAFWLLFNYLAAPDAFVHDWYHELFSRTIPFANLKYLAVVGLTLGYTPPVLILAAIGILPRKGESWLRGRGGESALILWILIYGAFVLYRTPHGHQYYLVGLLVPVALYAAVGGFRTIHFLNQHINISTAPVIVIIVIVVSLIAGVGLFGLAGDYSFSEGGETVSAEAGQYLATSIPDNSTVYVVNEYGPPLQWYAREGLEPSRINAYYISKFSSELVTDATNQTNRPVYLVYPVTADTRNPSLSFERIYMTKIYQPVLFEPIGSTIETQGKLRYFLDGRGVVIYRVNRTAH